MADPELNENITWTPYLTEYFSETGERAACLSWLHQKSEAYYDKRKISVEWPAIVLSGIIGFGSVGSSSLFAGDTEMASMILGLMSLFVSILQTTGSFFQLSKRAENHRLSAVHYGKLHRFIAVEMRLPEKERIRPADFLKMVKDTYDRLQETSPVVPVPIINDFKHKFGGKKYDDVSKPPEANGLERVKIYGDDWSKKPTIVIESISSEKETIPDTNSSSTQEKL
jgi:hypothetical protein